MCVRDTSSPAVLNRGRAARLTRTSWSARSSRVSCAPCLRTGRHSPPSRAFSPPGSSPFRRWPPPDRAPRCPAHNVTRCAFSQRSHAELARARAQAEPHLAAPTADIAAPPAPSCGARAPPISWSRSEARSWLVCTTAGGSRLAFMPPPPPDDVRSSAGVGTEGSSYSRKER